MRISDRKTTETVFGRFVTLFVYPSSHEPPRLAARREARDHPSMDAKIIAGSLVGATLINAVLAACASTNSANAQTAPTPVQVVVANCDKTFEVAGPPVFGGDGGISMNTTSYAEAAFPGVSAQQLAGHVTNWNTPAGGYPMPPGYALRQQDAIYTRDGFVGAGCSQGGMTTFIYAP